MIVIWRITRRCNLSCPFCAFDRRVVQSRPDADPEVIRRFGVALADFQPTTGERVLVSWMGGEPFLFPSLNSLTVFFTGELGLQVSATTNGTALCSATAREHVLAHFAELTFSVDGIGSAHDELRGQPGNFAALREAAVWIAGTKRRQSHGPRLRANIVLMRQTLSRFEELCLELAGWGIEEITFNQLGGRDRPEFFPAHRLLPEQAARFRHELPRLREQLAGRGVRLNGSGTYLERIQASACDEAIPVTDCHPGEQSLFVNEDGLASPCSFTTQDYGIPLAGLDSAGALRELPGRFARARRERRLAVCEDCQSTQVFEKFAA